MLWRVDVSCRPEYGDAPSASALAAFREYPLPGVEKVATSTVYLLEGDLDAPRVAQEALADPISEMFRVMPASEPPPVPPGARVVTIFKKPGVMDPVEASALKAVADLGMTATAVRIGIRHLIYGGPDDGTLRAVAAKVLANEAVDEVTLGERAFDRIALGAPYRFRRIDVPLRDLDDAGLLSLSRARGLSLNGQEMKAIQDHYRRLDREPTDVELETLAQTWSEHCKHKTLTSDIRFDGSWIRNLLQSTVFRATQELAKPWCVSVFKDNAGIIEFDEHHDVCFKVETHNHPSAIDPYGGSNTGVGGVIRDVLGCGLGAKPVAGTDVFCVGLPDADEAALLPGTIHPRRMLRGVVAGVRDYGNRIGLPTLNGAVFFDERYTGNPLVFCGTVGLLPKGKAFKRTKAGDAVLLVGGRTGHDGIHGATFSSVELHEESEAASAGAVQIGNAIVEKKVIDTVLQARDQDLFDGITDCGAGGLSSAVGEMGAELGAEVDLEKVPVKYEGLSTAEIWISEAQERMVLSVPPECVERILEVFRAEDVEATVIGRFTSTRELVLRYQGHEVGRLDMEFLHRGLPREPRIATWAEPKSPNPRPPEKEDYAEDLKKLLASWNICSKEWIIRQYDHEVQGGSVIKPLHGVDNDGPSDAAVFRPVLSSWRALAVGCGMNPRYGDLDPYQMAANAIDEAFRNVVSVGGDPDRTALLDNFSWGNPEDPETLGALVRAAQACYDVATAYGLPFISGKDSLNNEYRAGGRTVRIPHSLLISALSVVPDARRCVSADLKEPGNYVWMIGQTRMELGGSHYALVNGMSGGKVPAVEPELGRRVIATVANVISLGLARSCHDLSEGGLAVAAAEMAFAGGLGMKMFLEQTPVRQLTGETALLFSESPSRFLIEVRERDFAAFEKATAGVPRGVVGQVTAEGRLSVVGRSRRKLLDVPIAELKAAWQRPLRW
ncbi:MAG: phosphoribosylformylglycinamidine synthase subunit PurL [Planctomycetes bacterium]|nr:phosphoribosylformylglycinamidine synthase subunit PurL [Planctomycetota bacterium]